MFVGSATLIAKLLQIEQALGESGSSEVRKLIFEAQKCVLAIEQEIIDTLRENEHLRKKGKSHHFSWLDRFLYHRRTSLMKTKLPDEAKP